MQITGVHFNYYYLCHSKLWYFANGISMEHTSDRVYEGKLIHESSYPNRGERYKEVEIDGIKIDYYDHKNKVIHEIKKSDKMELAHEWQLKYYMYVLKQNGVEGVSGILEYPKLRKTTEVLLSSIDCEEIGRIKQEIIEIVGAEVCPRIVKKGICKSCSYFDFCFSGEDNIEK